MSKTGIFLFLMLALLATPAKSQEIVEVTYLQTRTLEELRARYNPLVENSVDLYRVLYTTTDLQGMRDTASGLLVLPVKEDKPMPIVIYQHGTVSAKEDVPSNLQGGYEIAEATGAFGFISLAPDYLGLGTSRGLHPYVHAASEAWVAIDMLKAVKPYLPQLNVQANRQLFITGYSQGGHAAMALHAELQNSYAAEFPVTAAVPMSGPYSISGEMKKLFLGDTEYFYPAYLAFTILSYDQVYGLFDQLEEYFQPGFARLIETNLTTTLSLSTLNTLLINGLKQKHGGSYPKYILQDSILQAVQSNPDHPANLAMKDNDVYEWVPAAPTRLLYCTADDQVPFTNSVLTETTMKNLNAQDVQAIDIKPDADHGQCVEPAVTAAIFFFRSFPDNPSTTQAVAPPAFRLFPNPATEQVQVQGVQPGTWIEWMDVNGRIRQRVQAQGETQELPVPPGGSLFFLRFRSQEGSWVRKVLVSQDR